MVKASKVVITGAAAVALVAGGTAVGAAVAGGPVGTWGVIHGCYITKAPPNGSHAFVLQDARSKCATGSTAISWNQTGPVGPPGRSGVVSMQQYQPNYAATVTGAWRFLGSPPEEYFTDRNTAAQITGTVVESQSDFNESGGWGYLGICYKPASGPRLTAVSQVLVGVPYDGPISGGATVSGVVGDLTSGKYYVGLCAADQGSKDGGDSSVINERASVTVIMAETASGVSYGTRRGATRLHPARG
jgi:hypothetical protein